MALRAHCRTQAVTSTSDMCTVPGNEHQHGGQIVGKSRHNFHLTPEGRVGQKVCKVVEISEKFFRVNLFIMIGNFSDLFTFSQFDAIIAEFLLHAPAHHCYSTEYVSSLF